MKFYNQLLLLYLQMLKLFYLHPLGISSRWFLSFLVMTLVFFGYLSCTFLSSDLKFAMFWLVGNIWNEIIFLVEWIIWPNHFSANPEHSSGANITRTGVKKIKAWTSAPSLTAGDLGKFTKLLVQGKIAKKHRLSVLSWRIATGDDRPWNCAQQLATERNSWRISELTWSTSRETGQGWGSPGVTSRDSSLGEMF